MSDGDAFFFVIISGIVLIVIIGILIYGYQNRCPKCEKWFERKVLKSDQIDQWTGYETITRTDITKDSAGKEISRTSRDEQIRMVYTQYENQCECNNCKHTWADVTTSKREG